MVTRAEIQAAKEQATQTEQKLGYTKRQVQEEIKKLTRRKRVPFTPRKERVTRKKFKRELTSAEKQIRAAEEKVTQYRQEVIQPAEQAISTYEIQKAAYSEAITHFNKGMAGAYLYHMRDSEGPYIAAVREHLNELVKQQRAGHISPTDTLLGKQRSAEAALAKQKITELRKELNIPFTGWEKTAAEINKRLAAEIGKPGAMVLQEKPTTFEIPYGPIKDIQKVEEYKIYTPERTIVTPTYGLGAGGTPTTIGTYQPRKDDFLDILHSVETAIVPSFALDRPTYLPTPGDVEKYKKLLEGSKYNPKIRYDLDRFLSAQEKKLEFDIRKANAINKEIKEGREVKDTTVFDRLKYGQAVSGGRGDIIGSGWQMALAGAELYEKEGKKVKIPFIRDVSGKAALIALKAGTEAYKAERDVLAFQLAGAGLGTMGLIPKVTGGAKSLRALRIASRASLGALGLSFGGLVGAREYQRTGDIELALGAGIGSTAGFFGAVYSKQVIEAPGKMGRWIAANIHAPRKIDLRRIGPRGKKGATVEGKKSKLAEQKLKEYQEKKARMTEEQAILEFKQRYKLRSDQIKIIENSIKGRVYVTQADLNKDLLKWKNFLKKTGLTELQVIDRLAEVTIRYKLRILINNYNTGLINEQQFKIKSKELSDALQKLRLKVQQLVIQEQAKQEIIKQDQAQDLLVIQTQKQRLVPKQIQRALTKQESIQLALTGQLSDAYVKYKTVSMVKQKSKQDTDQAAITAIMLNSLTGQESITKQIQKPKLRLPTPQFQAPALIPTPRPPTPQKLVKPAQPTKPIRPGDFGLDWLVFDKKKKRRPIKIRKKKKKKKEKKVLPTLTQKLIGYRGKKPIKYVTGFETIRII